MEISFTLNGQEQTWQVQPNETLMSALRRHALWSVKHGCESGECGSCTVLVDGAPSVTCVMLAIKAHGKHITTVESLASSGSHLHPLQEQFVETGAIQCGYCTPAQLLCAKALLDRTLNPTEAEVRECFKGVLCRCTGYVKPVQAVLRAAAQLRGADIPPLDEAQRPIAAPPDLFGVNAADTPFGGSQRDKPDAQTYPSDTEGGAGMLTRVKPIVVTPPDVKVTATVGKPEKKVDAIKLAMGKPVFGDDFEMRGMLYGALMTSPHAHARIAYLDTSKAKAIPAFTPSLPIRMCRVSSMLQAGRVIPIRRRMIRSV